MKPFLISLVVLTAIFISGSLLFSQHVDAQSSGKWWYTSSPSTIAITGETGEMRALWPGITTICSQKSKTERTNIQCYTVILSQIIPQ